MIRDIDYGDTFYYKGTVCMRVNASSWLPSTAEDCVYVTLDKGEMVVCRDDTSVIKADTKVVANTKEIQF
jgi:hypothetical protein